MPKKIDLEKERKKLDREITFFHFKRAKRIIVRALREARRQKNWFFIYYFTAQNYLLKEKFREAIRYLDKALVLNPNDGCSYNDKALCLAEMGEYEEALVVFDEGLERDRDCPTLYHNKGWLLNFLGEDKKAILYFHKALELDPDRVESLYSLGDSYYNLGMIKEAKKYFEKAKRMIKGRCGYLYREITKRIQSISLEFLE